jgi:hypothetical protein
MPLVCKQLRPKVHRRAITGDFGATLEALPLRGMGNEEKGQALDRRFFVERAARAHFTVSMLLILSCKRNQSNITTQTLIRPSTVLRHLHRTLLFSAAARAPDTKFTVTLTFYPRFIMGWRRVKKRGVEQTVISVSSNFQKTFPGPPSVHTSTSRPALTSRCVLLCLFPHQIFYR